MKELLEPIYLNEKMLLNCAGYLFDGIEFSKEIHEANENGSDKNLGSEGNLASNGITDLVGKLDGKINAELNYKNTSSFSSNSIRNISLGAIHMKVLKRLYTDKLIQNFSSFEENLREKPYIAIEADMKPVDFFELLQILKMISPQLHYLLVFLNANKQNQKKVSPNQQQLNKDIIELLKNLISELEKSYLESNLLEMLIYQGDRCIGVVDLDLDNSNPHKLKSQLNDGRFTIIGKITKTIDSEDRINLLQRNILTPLLTLVQKITVLVETAKNLDNAPLGEERIKSLMELKETAFSIISLLLEIYIDGPALRIRAMSVCI
ncbi:MULTISPECIES: hypothetical protein [Acinetobacter]|uniref:Uncharacterized protein n=1 Tax=Acinetobacter chengduensis TaxID=2420890 RepID=A0ABX9U0Y3_9GAMM|nr:MULTISPECIES: hypothetical protein [Acinetobacter]MBI1451144.1 hypothetical protein [Acinetobacter sp. FL51]RKG43613.1 hypothetical protein D7V31_03790 [Acinetobacter sp. WCHAc060007]RLL23984.1 hypothetical protein D9K81_02330 [Acinetobacter chengduensis]